MLIVDDERTVRDVARAALEIAGFTVELAVSGEQAIEEFDRMGDGVALVLLDLTLPGMSGRRVLEQLRERRPALPILLTSGYSVEEAADLVAQPGTAFIPKPWRPKDLIEEAQRLMDGVVRSRAGDGDEPDASRRS